MPFGWGEAINNDKVCKRERKAEKIDSLGTYAPLSERGEEREREMHKNTWGPVTECIASNVRGEPYVMSSLSEGNVCSERSRSVSQ